MVFLKGNTYGLPVQLFNSAGVVLGANDVAVVQFVFGKTEKFYGTEDGTVTYDENQQAFIVPLTQEETFAFSGSIKWQVRVIYGDGAVDGTVPKAENVLESITKTVLEVPTEEGAEEIVEEE